MDESTEPPALQCILILLCDVTGVGAALLFSVFSFLFLFLFFFFFVSLGHSLARSLPRKRSFGCKLSSTNNTGDLIPQATVLRAIFKPSTRWLWWHSSRP